MSGSDSAAALHNESSIQHDNKRVTESFSGRAREFIELHDQVQTSVGLLDSLETFLSTFQKDLSAVSGQISELQSRSKDIDSRLKSRRKIEKPLSGLLSNIVVPPPLATIILDTDVGEPWIAAIMEFEDILEMIQARARVKAAKDLGEVTEGLRIVAATKLRAFFLGLFQPIRSSVTTNMQVLQTSVILKYRTVFGFLQRHAPTVASEIQRAYLSAARTYYETGFRRYSRTLGVVRVRTTEPTPTIATGAGDKNYDLTVDEARLANAHIDGPAVTLAYMADNKAHTEPVEALFRSLLVVLMDNATAEYTFITAMFSSGSSPLRKPSSNVNVLSRTSSLLSPTGADDPPQSPAPSEYEGVTPRARAGSVFSASGVPRQASIEGGSKDEKVALDAAWKQVMDPVLQYCQNFVRSVLDPPPPVVPLLTMIRLTEDIMAEVQKRQPQCAPLESFIFGLRLQMWPIFQKVMSEHVDGVKKLAEGAGAGFFARGPQLTDAVVASVCRRYIAMFNVFVSLTEQDETMIFSNLLRLRQEVAKVIIKHTEKIPDPGKQATTQSSIYEVLLQGLSKGLQTSAHPKAQSEIAHWREKEEEARRRIVSASRR